MVNRWHSDALGHAVKRITIATSFDSNWLHVSMSLLVYQQISHLTAKTDSQSYNSMDKKRLLL